MKIENKASKNIVTVYFMALATMMYYFLTDTIEVGIFMSYRHFFALLIIFSWFVYFLIKPDVPRAVTSFKSAFVISMPTFVILTCSLLIWFVERTDIFTIFRGLSVNFILTNLVSFAAVAGIFLYLFGSKGIQYNLICLLIANLSMIATIMLEHGIGNYISELITLIITFAGQTGEIMEEAEIHELAFCFGPYLIYMFMFFKKDIFFMVLLGLSLFCFVSAFKRIAIIAIVLAVGVGYVLLFFEKQGKDKLVRKIIVFIMICMTIVLLLYVGAIKADLFGMLEEAGIETSGRARTYKLVNNYYEFSPAFIGRGMSYIAIQLNTVLEVGGFTAIHNDFLEMFVSIGFFGFILWMLAHTVVRTWYFGRDGKTKGAILATALIIYIMIVASTDNTMNYPLFCTSYAVIMMGYDYDKRVKEEKKKLFGYESGEEGEKV